MSIQNSEQEVIHVSDEWLKAGYTVYLVTVVRTWGSSPRPIGSIAAVREDGEIVGSVSGGCIEKQLVESLIRDEKNNSTNADKKSDYQSHKVSTLHISDEQARRFGLSCGGELELVFEQLSTADALSELVKFTKNRRPVRRSIDLSSGRIQLEETTTMSQPLEYTETSLAKTFGPDYRLLLIGAGQLSRYTAQFAMALDYKVLVCDPRPGFQEAWQVPEIPVMTLSPDDAVLQFASDSSAAVVALTHDPNVDDLALMEALPSEAFYVGALGSRRTSEKRSHRLLGLGLEKQDIDRLAGPIGIDIGSRSSAEIAISIVAQLIQVRSQKNS
jgi:xanthine dehydrogenase accessory factor